MTTTMTIETAQIDALAERLSSLEGELSDTDRVTLLAVFALAGEALDARIDAKTDVAGFALNAYNVGIQGSVANPPPGLADGLQASLVARKAGGKQQEYLRFNLEDILVTSV